MALLLTSVFGVTGCGSDDGEAPVESRIKNSTGDDINNDSKDDDFLDSNDLLPEDSDSTFIKNSPSGSGELDTQNLLNAGHHLGVNTAGCNMRNANRGLRSELPNPQVQVSPWLQSTICPDLLQEKSLLDAGHHVSVDTAGCNLRSANTGLRSEPPNPQVQVSPWLHSTICPDLMRRPLE
jgi:hypothetical protein